MKGRQQRCRDEVTAANLSAANAQADAATTLDDPEVMYVLETAVGGSDRRIYELSLGRVIARLAEELSVMEVQLSELKTSRREMQEPEPAGSGRSRR